MPPIINIFINTLKSKALMKGFLLTHKGMEDTASKEVKGLIGKKSMIDEGCAVFTIKTHADLFKLCYLSQSAIGVSYLLAEFNFKDILKDFKNNITKIKFYEWLKKKTQFKVKCIKNQENISTPELERDLGEIIIDHIQDKHGYKQKVNLENPEIIIFVYLTKKKCYVGIDFVGFDLDKRSYKIFSHAADIKGTIAYFLVSLSNYIKNETLLDLFSGSGTIAIEAALSASNFPINYYNKGKFIFLNIDRFKKFDFNGFFEKLDKEISSSKLNVYNVDSSMNYLNYCKKNSKLAGVDKMLKFSRMDLEWLDTKFKQYEIDKIVTKLPMQQELYTEFFYQAEYILNKKGKMVLIGDAAKIKETSEKYKFKITAKREVYSGQKKYDVFVLTK